MIACAIVLSIVFQVCTIGGGAPSDFLEAVHVLFTLSIYYFISNITQKLNAMFKYLLLFRVIFLRGIKKDNSECCVDCAIASSQGTSFRCCWELKPFVMPGNPVPEKASTLTNFPMEVNIVFFFGKGSRLAPS